MLFVGTSIIHPSTEGVFLLCNILDLLIYSTLEDCEQKASDLKKEGYQHVILFYKGEEELESYSWEYVEQHKI